MQTLKTEFGTMEVNSKGFVKYTPNIKLRTSNIDTFVSCPLQSTLPFDMDVFTANIGHLLHYAHQQPKFADLMVDNFMNQYQLATNTIDNELRDMLKKFIQKGLDFLDSYKDAIKIFEPPLTTQIDGVRIEGHPDVIIIDYKGSLEEYMNDENKDKYDVFILDFKTSQNPGSYEGCLDISDGVHKAQPYFYGKMVCDLLKINKVGFFYFVYTKTKSVKLYKHGDVLSLDSLNKITTNTIQQYLSCYESDMWYPKKGDFCYNCPLGPKGDNSCPLFN